MVSATHRNLEEPVAAGNFREYVYYRLNVVTLRIPPLSERREDIPLLAAYFLRTLQPSRAVKIRSFSPEALDLLVAAPWPGNVRQLRNVVEQALALATSSVISVTLVQSALRNKSAEVLSFVEAKERFEHDYLVQLLQITQGNVSRAARLARRERTKAYKLLHRHQLDPRPFLRSPS